MAAPIVNDETTILIRDLIAAGVDASLIARVSVLAARVAVHGRVHGRSLDASADAVLAARRAADRARKKTERIQLKAGKQTMSGQSETVQGLSEDASKDKGLSACNLLPSLSSSEVQESKEVVVERQARARGTRLSTETKISTENRYFAAAAGIPEGEIDRVWAEFIDYWIAVPGARGTKLNWDATWRNRVRTLTPWKGKANGAGTRSLAAAADDLIARAKEREQQEDHGFLDLTVESS